MNTDKLSTSDIAGAAASAADAGPASEREGEAREQPRMIDQQPEPLFATGDASGYRTRWSGIQTGFVDEPHKAVEEADSLVAEVMQRLAAVFADERKRLESQWERNDQISTEDLRQAMRRYRSFFERLLAI